MGNKQIEYSRATSEGDQPEGETKIYRSLALKVEEDLIADLYGDVFDMKTMLLRSFTANKDRPCLGTREKTEEQVTNEETKETTTQQVYGKYMYMTYQQVHEFSEGLAKALYKNELCPEKEVDTQKLRFLGIYSRNREEWCLTDCACILGNIVSVPLYDTLGDSSIEFIINQTEMESIACGADKVKNLCRLKKEGKIESIKNVVLFDEITKEIETEAEEAGLKVYRQLNLAEEGEKWDIELENPTKDSLYTLCYTSGTTGDPKGVISTHLNMIATIGGAARLGIEFHQDDIHYSYLPLAHVFERLCHVVSLNGGARIGYYQGDITKIRDDLSALKPTIFPSVPRLLNRFYDLMTAGIKQQTGFKKFLVNWGINSKTKSVNSSGDFKHGIFDKLVFKKFRDILGGRVRLMITGSAPISAETMRFLKIAFSCEIYEAYGQTETTGGSFATDPYDKDIGHVGGPTPHTEFKLVDVPEMDYTSKDIIDGINQPRGEICIRGPSCFNGYFRNEEKTKETIDDDGWVHTGDIGVILENGALRIIDRKKNIFKLAQGEYIAAEKLENAYTQIDLVKQIFVYGDSLQHFLVSIIVPDKDEVEKWAKKENLEGTFEELIKTEEFKTYIQKEIQDKKKDYKFNSLEVPKKIHYITEEFTIDNDMLTPTFKLKRNEAKKAYFAKIKDMYEGAKLQGE